VRLRHLPREASRLVRRALGFGRELGEEYSLITRHLRPGDTFVDVGAHEGTFSLYAGKQVGPSGVVLAIEPNPQVLERLRSNIAASALKNVQVAPFAVGEEDGEAVLYVFKQNTRSSLYPSGRATRHTLDASNKAGSLTVPLKPLSSILVAHRIETVHAMKIDVEGYEDRVLIPFFDTVPRELWPHRLLIERSPHIWKRDCIDDMLARGYHAAWQGRGDTLLSL
jgi:FkbM family methyltransferase